MVDKNVEVDVSEIENKIGDTITLGDVSFIVSSALKFTDKISVDDKQIEPDGIFYEINISLKNNSSEHAYDIYFDIFSLTIGNQDFGPNSNATQSVTHTSFTGYQWLYYEESNTLNLIFDIPSENLDNNNKILNISFDGQSSRVLLIR